MAILPKCQKCKRLGGYARKSDGLLCARCEQAETTKPKTKKEENKE